MYCKPTFIRDDIILPFTGHELVRRLIFASKTYKVMCCIRAIQQGL